MNETQPYPLQVEHFAPQRPPLRVAVVTETYPPEVNGVALTIERLVHGLQQRQHSVQLIRPRQGSGHDSAPPPLGLGVDELLMRGLPIPRYPQLRVGWPAKRALLAEWGVHRPDVVHIATEGPLGWSALQAARKLRLPVSSDFRTNFHAYSRHYGMAWLQKPIAAYLRKFHNLADCTMVPTAALQADLYERGFQRLHVVARGVDTQRFDPAHRRVDLRARWGAGDGTPVVLCVGRLAPEKNLGLLLRAYAAMRSVRPEARLVLVGDGPERAALAAACPDAIMAGPRTGQDLAEHYASADLFLFPSLTETYGNVTPEALASGLAVLAFDHAAAADLIRSGDNGLLVPCGDGDAFVRRATDLVADPDGVARLRARARASTQTQDWGRIVAQVETLWRGLCPGVGARLADPNPGPAAARAL